MDDFDATPQPSARGDGGKVMAVFLGLYLLILAFFIILVAISSPEKVKSRAVMDSLTSTFATMFPSSTDLTAFNAREGDIIGGQQFQAQVSGVFSTALQVAKVRIVQPGRRMRVLLPSNSLFFPGKAEIRPARYPLLDRIVAALSSRPPGLRFDMEFIIESDYAVGKSLPIGQTLEMARAGAFVHEMLSRGVPPDSVSIGIKPGDPRNIEMWFHTRFLDEDRLRFEEFDRNKEG